MATIGKLLAVHGNLCHICGTPMDVGTVNELLSPSVDHVIPVFLGGHNRQSNLRPAHRICNSTRKHDPITDELRSKCLVIVANVREGKFHNATRKEKLRLREERKQRLSNMKMEARKNGGHYKLGTAPGWSSFD
jgi:hypothetical protein